MKELTMIACQCAWHSCNAQHGISDNCPNPAVGVWTNAVGKFAHGEGDVTLEAALTVPDNANGIVVFAHGSGSSRHSPRNRFVANELHAAGLATLLIDVGDDLDGMAMAVAVLQGQVFMANTDSPFRVGDQALAEMKAKRPDLKVVVVDIHAEATSEKQAIGWWFDGRASLVIGTHTHVPTADARLLPKGTAYQGDAGMTGAYEGIIGFDPKAILEKFLYQTPRSMETATRDVRMCGAIVDVDEATGKARGITSIQERLAS